jgi:hypothetical protein
MANDLLTKEEDAQAAAQGWGLYHVYDMAVDQWVIRVLPAEATNHVVNLARNNYPLPLKALRLMTHYKGKT